MGDQGLINKKASEEAFYFITLNASVEIDELQQWAFQEQAVHWDQ